MPDRHKLSAALMIVSLLLLVAFLVLFLKKSWDDEVLSLKKETGFLFINSVRGIEGRMMDQLLMEGLWSSPDSMSEKSTLRLRRPVARDSIKIMTFISEEKHHSFGTDSNVQVRIAAKQVGQGEAEMAGSLSMVMALSYGDKKEDSTRMAQDQSDFWAMLDSNFTNSMRNAGLPIGFKVVHLGNDSICPAEGFRSGSYTDLATGDSYVAELSGYNGYLFRKILPELLFAVGLFGCVSLAFFTVFKNLKAQQRLTELKNDFIQNMTHELKTPIATVGVAIEALRHFDALENPARTREYLDISKSELNRLSLLVEKVLRTSLFEKTEPVLHLAPVDLRAIVEDVLASMRLLFEKQAAKVNFEHQSGPFTGNGDREHLASVVFNLLDNALKYSPDSPDIAVRLFSEGEEICLEIADRGIGIPTDCRERVFEKFYRVPSGNVHDVKGHGLGLSYVSAVVRKHNGRIAVEEREGGGAVFKVWLNLQ